MNALYADSDSDNQSSDTTSSTSYSDLCWKETSTFTDREKVKFLKNSKTLYIAEKTLLAMEYFFQKYHKLDCQNQPDMF